MRPDVPQRFDGREQRLGAHHHAGTTAVRVVVDGPMTAEAVLAQVVDAEGDDALLRGTPDDRGPQRQIEELGKDRDDVDPHRRQRTSSASSSVTTMRPASRSMASTTERSAGTSRSPSGPDDAVHLVPAGAEDLDELADRSAALVLDPQPDQVVPVVGIVRQRRDIGLEEAADERLRRPRASQRHRGR